MNPFIIHEARGSRVPILLSVPHCGTAFPSEIENDYQQDLIHPPDDTDFFVDRLYDFAPLMGITMIAAVYNRWVVDLNRDPDNKPLYSDGRIITGLCPVTNFLGENLYVDGRKEVHPDETTRRLKNYYLPYHAQLRNMVEELRAEFGQVLLWECHSIRQYVNTVYDGKIPDMILGDADGVSASAALTQIALENLSASNYSVNHNFPFKGGYITRHFGKPHEHVHALQLEMTKVNYMDDTEMQFAAPRAGIISALLEKTMQALAATLGKKQ